MTGPGRPVRQPANTRASVLLTCVLRLAAFHTCLGLARSAAPAAAAIENGERHAPGRCGRFHRQPPGSFPAAAARSGGRIVRAVGGGYTAVPGNWAPVSRPVRVAGGVCTGGGTRGTGRRERRVVTADLLSRA